MGRKREDAQSDLPKYLYCRNGRYVYRHPMTKAELPLGRDRTVAVGIATDWNAKLNGAVLESHVKRTELRHVRKTLGDVDERSMLREHSIVLKAIPATVCGVYFLLHNQKIVYVGQSIDCLRRVASHKIDKTFDAYHIIPLDRSALVDVEAAYIAKYRPKYNKAEPMDYGQDLASYHAMPGPDPIFLTSHMGGSEKHP